MIALPCMIIIFQLHIIQFLIFTINCICIKKVMKKSIWQPGKSYSDTVNEIEFIHFEGDITY